MRVKAEIRGAREFGRAVIGVEKRMEKAMDNGTREVADAIVSDIKNSWSVRKPSLTGNPPAKDTGNLDSSIKVQASGRDLMGRFAGKNSVAHYITVDATEGNVSGKTDTNYARPLELGWTSAAGRDIAPRPFIEPAMRNAQAYYAGILIRNWRYEEE